MQEINLYQPIFRERKPMFSARALAASLALAIIGLASVYGFARWQVEALDSEVSILREQRTAAQDRLTGLMKSIPQRRESKLLKRQIAALTTALYSKRATVKVLGTRIEHLTNGFSAYLEGLARQRLEGLWLTGLNIADGGRTLELTGRAIQPELVPELVDRLAREPVFAGLRFNTLNIEREAGDGASVTFILRTHTLEENDT